jgi:predicted ATPase
MKINDLISDLGCRQEDIYTSLLEFDLIDKTTEATDLNLSLDIADLIKKRESWNDWELLRFLDNFMNTKFPIFKNPLYPFMGSPVSFIHKYGVFNYRVFKNETDVNMKPITLLFGANSSGKSSFLRSFLSFEKPDSSSRYKPNENSNNYLLQSDIQYGFYTTYKSTDLLRLIDTTDRPFGIGIPGNPRVYKLLESTLRRIDSVTLREIQPSSCDRSWRNELLIDKKLFLENKEGKSGSQIVRECKSTDSEEFLDPIVREFVKEAFGINNFTEETFEDGLRLIQAMLDSCRFSNGYLSELCRPTAVNEKGEVQKRWIQAVRKLNDKGKGTERLVSVFHDYVVQVLNLLLDVIYRERDKLFDNIVYLGPVRPIPKPYFTLSDHIRNSEKTEWDLLLKDQYAMDYVNRWISGRDKLDMGIKLIKVVYSKSDTYWQSLYGLGFSPEHDKAQRKSNEEENLQFKSHDQDITFLRVRDMRRGLDLDYTEVGVGISQILPVIVACCGEMLQSKHICIEQPELHLHPALQARLGDLFIESALGSTTQFARTGPEDDDWEDFQVQHTNSLLIETHSEHLILRILRRIKETTLYKEQGIEFPEEFVPITPEDVAVYYVSPGEEGSTVKELPITPDGDFAENWPNGFFEERLDELV